MFVAGALAQDPTPFTCCDDPGVEKTVKEYLRLQDAVRRGDRETSMAYLMATSSEALTRSRNLPSAHKRTAADLAKLLNKVKDKSSLIHAHIADISQAITYLALNHAGGGKTTLLLGKCANTTSWVQTPGALTSPFAAGKNCTTR